MILCIPIVMKVSKPKMDKKKKELRSPEEAGVSKVSVRRTP